MANAASKAEYLAQVSSIVKGVDDSLGKQEGLAEQKESKLEQMKTNHQNVSAGHPPSR